MAIYFHEAVAEDKCDSCREQAIVCIDATYEDNALCVCERCAGLIRRMLLEIGAEGDDPA